MVREITIEEFYQSVLPLIDVRSPAEFSKGHIPGAINIPLFSDSERAHVGTVYVRNSQAKATELAYQYINPKLNDFIAQSKKVSPDGKVVVHCWRGGMRSQSFARHLNENGFSDVSTIIGGYKSYRNHVLSSFELPCKIRIIGGYTGSGKSHIIRYFRDKGLQVIDLEKMANHKGSVFGGIRQPAQPTSEQFENNLFGEWRILDHSEPVWLEDESHNIGGVNIPLPLYKQMLNSPLYFLSIPKEKRAGNLVEEYACADPGELADSIRRIHRRLGGLNTTRALEFLDEKQFYEVAMLALQYYDKSYLKGISYRKQTNIFKINSVDTNTIDNGELILKYIEQHEYYKTYTI